MALNIPGYVDPGSYQQEVVVPGAGSITTIPFTACYIGTANRSKRSNNEAVIRGQIAGESLAFVANKDYLGSLALRKYSTTTMYKDGSSLVSEIDWTFVQPFVSAAYTSPTDLSTKNTLTFALDGKLPITMALTASAAGTLGTYTVTLVAGTQNRFQCQINGTANLTAISGATLAAAINATLNFADATALSTTAALAYGPTYNSVASFASSTLTLTSVATNGLEDVVIWRSHVTASDMASSVAPILDFTATTLVALSGGLHARTQVELVGTVGSSTYTIDYVGDSTTDATSSTNMLSITRVGNYAGVTSYTSGVDYVNGTSNIAWGGVAWQYASVTGVAGMEAGGTYNVSVNNAIMLSIDGKAAIEILLSGNATPPPGGPNPATPALATAAELVAIINANLAASKTYGPRYNAVASVASSKVSLASPTAGAAGQVEIDPPTANSAVLTVFGLSTSQLPYAVRGTGSAPALANIYYVTFDYARPSTDYNLPKQFFSIDAARADLGSESASNQLMLAATIAFKNGAPSIYVIQVDDSTVTGSPTVAQIEAALAHAGDKSAITEVVALSTDATVRNDVMAHITDQCSPQIQQPRRGWYGMARGTAVGDRDTAGTLIYTATKSMQVAADSPSRGRHFLMGPTKASITITTETGVQQRVQLDGSFVAAGAAAMFTARQSVAASLMTTPMLGFNIDDFETYLPIERKMLANNGVCVVTLDADRLIMLDPISTERGGGRLPQFEEPSASSQKDNVVANVNAQLAANAKGVVPSDLTDFIFTLKSIIGGVLEQSVASGDIGPFRDNAGRTRALNYTVDIQVFQSASDARKYTFRYFFMLRYPAKWFFGEYSVDNPFFSPTGGSLVA